MQLIKVDDTTYQCLARYACTTDQPLSVALAEIVNDWMRVTGEFVIRTAVSSKKGKPAPVSPISTKINPHNERKHQL